MKKKRARRADDGFLLLGVLTTILVMGILSGAVMQDWSIILRREREAELLFIQEQYAAAITEYQKGQGALPTELDQLEDKGQKGELYLRKMYTDPLTPGAKLEDWCLLRLSAGGQVVSSCEAEGTPEGGLLGGFGGAESFQGGEEATPGRPRARGGLAPGQSGIVGVHSKSTERAFNTAKRGEETYDRWHYTTEDFKKDIGSRNIPGLPSRGGPGVGQGNQQQLQSDSFGNTSFGGTGAGNGSRGKRGGSSSDRGSGSTPRR